MFLKAARLFAFKREGRTISTSKAFNISELTHSRKLQEDIFFSVFEDIDEAVYVCDLKTHEILYLNKFLRKRYGAVTGMKCYEVFQQQDSPCSFCTNKYIAKGSSGNAYVWEMQNRINNHWYRCIDKAIKWIDGKKARLEIAIDITEKKKIQQALEHSRRRYRAVVEDQTELICRWLPGGMLTFVNEAYCRYFGKTKQELLGSNFMQLIPDKEHKGIKARFALLNSKNPILEQEHIVFAGSGEERRQRWTNRAIFDKSGHVMEVQSVGRDITEQKKAEEDMRLSLQRSNRIIEGTIQAMAKTVEMRDPYTAGHQRRVSKLACIIAKRMGLSQEQTEAVRVSSTLHDIGKIYVPAEILSKPGVLNETERTLIREHPRVGFEILKTEEFPWPIADIVFQHHERMDGSGYPEGLSGKDIRIEARIIAVADIVEAMASHRPYRPALGINKALEELKLNKGKLYDKQVAEICIKLFLHRRSTREK
jgi:PAS domain S-box-containing protein/putative nucleotidyltransferase with HDIG domain